MTAKALRAEDLRRTVLDPTGEMQALRAHVAGLVGALDACRRTIGGRDEDHPVVEQADYVLRVPDLAALVGREQKRDAVIEAAWAVRAALTLEETENADRQLREALDALDTPKPLENE